MATIETDYEGIKQMGKELLQALPKLARPEQVANGTKAFMLAYLGLSTADQFLTRESGLYDYVTRRAVAREVDLMVELGYNH